MRQLINNTLGRGIFGIARQIRTFVGRVVADAVTCAVSSCARTVFSWSASASVSRYPATLKSRAVKQCEMCADMVMQAAGLAMPRLALVAVGHAWPVTNRQAHRLMRQS